jgi:parallel beta-helix repeat protein
VSSTDYPYLAGHSFYLDNTLAALDAAGEWYCDPNTNKVYFYAPGGVNPGTLTVMGCTFDYGVANSQSNSIIQNIAFQYQASAGIYSSGSVSSVSILSNDIFGQKRDGIEFAGGPSTCTISGNTIQNVNGRGIDLDAPNYFTVSNNTIKSIGLIGGYGISGEDGATAILSMYGGHNNFTGNTIDSVGYNGIRYDGAYNRIENNSFSNTMMRLSDGGAIYAFTWMGHTGYESYGSTIHNNIIENVVGDATYTASPYAGQTNAYGIYFDNACYNMVADGNTIIHARDAGIYSHINEQSMIIRNNTIYECGSATGEEPSYLLIQSNASNPGFVFNHNIMYPPALNKQYIVLLNPSLPTSVTPGAIDSNYYFNPYNTSNTFLSYDDTYSNYTFYTYAAWKTFTGLEKHSTIAAGTNQKLFTNKTSSPVAVTLSPTSYKDVTGASVTGSITLQPYASRLLFVDNSIPLPVELVSFTMAKVNGVILLNWKTATEVSNYGFDIERKATGAGADTAWTKIGFVPGNGSTSSPHAYSYTDQSVTTAIYSYRLKQIDTDGRFVYSSVIQMSVTAVAPTDLPTEFALDQNYPNPFNPSTTVHYSVAAAGPVRLSIFDITGREVATLVNSTMAAGNYSVQWNAKDMPSGVYIYRMTAGSFTSVKKLLLQK